jgi:hypothetical protein
LRAAPRCAKSQNRQGQEDTYSCASNAHQKHRPLPDRVDPDSFSMAEIPRKRSIILEMRANGGRLSRISARRHSGPLSLSLFDPDCGEMLRPHSVEKAAPQAAAGEDWTMEREPCWQSGRRRGSG